MTQENWRLETGKMRNYECGMRKAESGTEVRNAKFEKISVNQPRSDGAATGGGTGEQGLHIGITLRALGKKRISPSDPGSVNLGYSAPLSPRNMDAPVVFHSNSVATQRS